MDTFKKRIQKAIPTVYDNSLSYYEVLRKVLGRVDVVEQSNSETVAIMAQYDSRLASVESSDSEQSQIVASLDTRLDVAEPKITTLQSEMATEKPKITSLQSDMTAEKAKIAGLQADNTTNKANIATLQSTKADKLMATNLVTNGDFSNGTTGFVADGTTSVNSGVVTFTTNIPNGKFRTTAMSVTTGHKYYMRVRVLAPYTNVFMMMYDGVNSYLSPNLRTSGVWSSMSLIATSSTTSAVAQFQFVRDANTSGWQPIQISHPLVINLTETFGAGNEPTLAEMDLLMSQFSNSWFNGTQELLSLKAIQKELSSKADKVQEAWITPTLTNGAVQSVLPVQYMKDTLGFVHMRGRLTIGTSATGQFTLPSGYRPSVQQYGVLTKGATATSFGRCDVNTNGVVIMYEANGTSVDLTPIVFKAEL